MTTLCVVVSKAKQKSPTLLAGTKGEGDGIINCPDLVRHLYFFGSQSDSAGTSSQTFSFGGVQIMTLVPRPSPSRDA